MRCSLNENKKISYKLGHLPILISISFQKITIIQTNQWSSNSVCLVGCDIDIQVDFSMFKQKCQI